MEYDLASRLVARPEKETRCRVLAACDGRLSPPPRGHWERAPEPPSQWGTLLKKDDPIKAVVLGIDKANEKFSLGINSS